MTQRDNKVNNSAPASTMPGDQDEQLNRAPQTPGKDEQASMDAGKLDEAVRRGDTAKRADEQRGNLTRVEIEGAGDPIENQVIGDLTFGRDSNGKVAFVDFGGAKSKASYAGE